MIGMIGMIGMIEMIRKSSILVGRAGRKVFRHPREALLLIRMAGWVAILSASVRLTSLPRALELVSTPVRLGKSVNEIMPAQLAHAIDLLLRTDLLLFRKSCWKRAVILHRYLALNGIESRINFGVRKDPDGRVAGHAWLERHGESLLEVIEPEYVVTFSFPAEDLTKNRLHLIPTILQH
jgi:hypothetical protein